MVYGPRPVEAVAVEAAGELADEFEDEGGLLPEPSADARAAVQAAVAQAVRPSATGGQATLNRRGQYGPIRSHAEARPTQDRLPRVGPAADSPLLVGGPVYPSLTATGQSPAMMWPPPGLSVPVPGNPGYGLPTAQPMMVQAMLQPTGQPMVQPTAQPMVQPIPGMVFQTMPYPASGPLGPTIVQPMPSAGAGSFAHQPVVQAYLATGGQPLIYGGVAAPAPPTPVAPSPAPTLNAAYRPPASRVAVPVKPVGVNRDWVVELLLAISSAATVGVAAVVWGRTHERVRECVGGCLDLEAVTSAARFNGWAVIALAAIGLVMAGLSLRRTRGTDAVRVLGALALIASLVVIALGVILLTTSLP
jgi:hypothetical protein